MSDSAIWTRNGITDTRLVRNFAYLGGKWVAGEDGETIAVRNPGDGAALGDVASLSADQARLAVDAAQDAFDDWAMTLPQDRSAILRRWFDLMIEHKEDLARIMVLEQGKPLSEARGEIDYAASFVEYYAEESKRPNIEGVTSHLPDAEVELWLEPQFDLGIGQMAGHALDIGALGLLGIVFHETRRIVDLAARLRQRLALLQHHDPREVLAMLDHQVEPAAQDGRAVLRQGHRPVVEGLLRGIHRQPRLTGAEAGHVAKRCAVGGVAYGDGLTILASHPFTAQVGEIAHEARVGDPVAGPDR